MTHLSDWTISEITVVSAHASESRSKQWFGINKATWAVVTTTSCRLMKVGMRESDWINIDWVNNSFLRLSLDLKKENEDMCVHPLLQFNLHIEPVEPKTVPDSPHTMRTLWVPSPICPLSLSNPKKQPNWTTGVDQGRVSDLPWHWKKLDSRTWWQDLFWALPRFETHSCQSKPNCQPWSQRLVGLWHY